jgi:excisionase family DNA binding protein
MSDRLLISQKEACQRLGVSRPTLITEIEAGRLSYVRVGKRRKFTPQELAAYVERQVRGCDGRVGPRGRLSSIATARPRAIDFETALALTSEKPLRSARRRQRHP